jgi:hypothetical protein
MLANGLAQVAALENRASGAAWVLPLLTCAEKRCCAMALASSETGPIDGHWIVAKRGGDIL